MAPKAHLVHSVPGRVRLRVSERRGDRGFFSEVERRLQSLEAVRHVETNPITGSVLVQHEGEIADLIGQAFGANIGELVEIALNLPPVARRLASEMTAIDRNIQDFTGGEIDLRTLASIGLLAMAAMQLIGGQQPVIAVSLGWYASELLRRSANAPAESGTG
ncbi:MAG TPA: hypothetical protein VGM07_01900 [Stellaceae bacterium]|jgi:hypothetical protein